MFCVKCGKPVKDGARFCTYCGHPIEDPAAAVKNIQPAVPPSNPPAPKPPQKKKKTALIVCSVLGVVLIAAVAAAIVIFTGKNSDTDDSEKIYAQYMDEGQELLDTHDYEGAKAAFSNAIDIDPDNKMAYLKLAEVYMGMDLKEDAVDTLHTALNDADLKSSDEDDILQYIEDIENGKDILVEAIPEDPQEDEGSDKDVSPDTLVFLERPQLVPESTSQADEGPSPSVAPYTIEADLSNVTNLDQFYLQPDSEQAQLLAQNMFYVTEGYFKEFYEVYEDNRYALTPSFITVDSMMHTYHLYFSYLMKKTERDYLADTLTQLSQAMLDESINQYSQLKGSEWETAALRNMAFFSVGLSLQNPEAAVPKEAAALVSQELESIMSASGVNNCPLTNTMIDYSQFKPRGYYAGDPQLEQYFRAMMWYGQIGFIHSDEELDRSAMLIALAMNQAALDQWEAIYVVTSFFAGASDDLSYYEYLPAIEAAYGSLPEAAELAGNADSFDTFRQYVDDMSAPAINSIPTMDDENPDTKSTEQNKGFRFMGQRFTIDAAIFQQLIYENVKEASDGSRRMLPDTLDVAAALGSDVAYDILDSQGATDYPNYTENMDALRTGLASAPDTLWNASLYSSWLYTLTPLLEQKGEGYPSFMTSTQWATKNLETFAGSYTELKHDTVLYAKQVMAEMGGGELPQWDDRGYVEPEVEVWARFANLAAKTAEGLKSYGLLSEEDETNLKRLEEMANQFLVMSEKELSNTLLSDEEFDLIRNYGGNLEHFWLEAFKDEGENITSGDFPAAIVTDIATDPNGSCLQVATGNPSQIFVIVPIDGELHICVGATYSFYQFEQPLSNRLTDSDWRQMMGISATDEGTYNYDSDIPQPDWTQSYRFEYTY